MKMLHNSCRFAFSVIAMFAFGALLAQNEVQYPYNPDVDANGHISVTDMLQVLGVYDQAFTPEGIIVDGQDLVDWILLQDALHASPVVLVDTLVGSQSNQDDEPFALYELVGSLEIGKANNLASGIMSVAIGRNNTASGAYSVASGVNNVASGNFAHAEGYGTTASGTWSAHAEGEITTASGMYSHAEGRATTAAFQFCHAEGVGTYAYGRAGHAEGGWTESRSEYGHTQNYMTSTYQYAPASSAAGYHTRADQPHQFVVGRSNVHEVEGSLFVVGNGGLEDDANEVNDADRSDAFRVFENGNAWVSDTLLAQAVRIGEMDLVEYLEELSSQIQSFVISGCTDPLGCNYNPQASLSEDVCTYGVMWYQDADGDGLGNSEIMLEACSQPAGYVADASDNCDNAAAMNFDSSENDPCIFAECNPVEFHGYSYAVVAIGNQCWFAENLQTLQFTNSDSIPSIVGNDGVQHNPANWPSLAGGPGVSCFDMSQSNFEYFGGLYNWQAVNDDRGICPVGWHVPSDLEWIELEMHLGMPEEQAYNAGYYRGIGFEINQKLRSPLFSNGSNESGFSALPGGRISHDGYQMDLGMVADFWTSTSMGGTAWNRQVGAFSDGRVNRELMDWAWGKSVRCVQD